MKMIEWLRVWFETIGNKSQTLPTSYQHGTPLIVLLAEDAHSEIDIVKEHHHQNHFPCAPDPQHLCNIHQQDLQDVLLDQHSPPSVTQQVSAPGELGGPTTKLHSYPYKFHEIIEWAKQLAQCGAAADPFPSRACFVDEKSALYITKAMAECEQMGVLILSGYWPDYHKDLGILAQEYVMWHHLLGSNRLVEENLANAQELIQGMQFMRDGVEEDGTTWNMASPALVGLIVDFFYATPATLGNLFLEVFAQEVPKPVIYLAVTAAAINEDAITGI
ncbi:hypothetical protein PISMIDRAFT_9612 [Pisolithus microcarpus 441]|uniref:DUF6532 domain-containing protein n=1 Tax=Pisolithus microcarpus 441 TaxID=765257 RepID=A0A0C9ZT11_9AGAM|nr:hypothetical protein BKA83DRAFT_9612 [Pisolithus microcarpus]KIK25402.1 hypothetical protein PISMIDRAFT_9612 [Pisolithus microcarpus 441]